MTVNRHERRRLMNPETGQIYGTTVNRRPCRTPEEIAQAKERGEPLLEINEGLVEEIAAMKSIDRERYEPVGRRGEFTSRTLESDYAKRGGYSKMRRKRKIAARSRAVNRKA
jgi:hypothetical protein